jgi:hypothetical protein
MRAHTQSRSARQALVLEAKAKGLRTTATVSTRETGAIERPVEGFRLRFARPLELQQCLILRGEDPLDHDTVPSSVR